MGDASEADGGRGMTTSQFSTTFDDAVAQVRGLVEEGNTTARVSITVSDINRVVTGTPGQWIGLHDRLYIYTRLSAPCNLA